MTVPSITRKVEYTGNGVTTVFPFSFPVYSTAHLVVQLYEIATETYTTLSAYTTTGVGPGSTGGTVTYLAISSSYKIIIERVVPFTQLIDINNQGGFYPDVLEQALDLLTMAQQQLDVRTSDITARGLRVPAGETVDELPAYADMAGKLLGFDSLRRPVGYDLDPVPLAQTGPDTVGTTELKVDAVETENLKASVVTWTKLDPVTVRIPMQSAATIYLNASTGNNANAGDVGTPLQTLQGAFAWAAKRDTRGADVTVRLAAGTYASGLNMTHPLVGGGKLIIVNDGAVLVTDASSCFTARYGAQLEIRPNGTHSFEARGTGASSFVMQAQWGGGIKVGAGFTYGQGHITTIHNYATRGGANIEIENGCRITGGGDDWAQASHSGNIRLAGGTITIGANITFTGSFLYSLAAADITATGGLTVDYGVYTVSAIRWRVRGSVIQWIFAYGGRDGPPGNSPGLEYEGGIFMEGTSPYGSAPADAGQVGDCEMGSFTADMSLLSNTVVPITGLDWMPSRVEFRITSSGLANAYGEGTWIRSKNTNYAMAKRPTTGDMFPSAVSSLYFFSTDTAGFTGTVTAWSTYGFSMTLSKFLTPAGTATVHWTAYR